MKLSGPGARDSTEPESRVGTELEATATPSCPSLPVTSPGDAAPRASRSARPLPSLNDLCVSSTINVPSAQRMQRAFIYLELPVCASLDRVLSQAARVTDWGDAACCLWTPPVHWLLCQRHHISLTRPFSVPAMDESLLPARIAAFARGVSCFPLKFASFDCLTDDSDRLVYIAAAVDDRSRSDLAALAQTVHQELVSLLSVRPEAYYSDNRFHVSFLAALLKPSSPAPSLSPSTITGASATTDQGKSTSMSTGTLNELPWQGGTPFDRSQTQLCNAELLLRKTKCLDASQGLYRGTMPPPPGVSRDQPAVVVEAAEETAGTALRALPPVRPASLCLRLGRQFFTFPLRE